MQAVPAAVLTEHIYEIAPPEESVAANVTWFAHEPEVQFAGPARDVITGGCATVLPTVANARLSKSVAQAFDIWNFATEQAFCQFVVMVWLCPAPRVTFTCGLLAHVTVTVAGALPPFDASKPVSVYPDASVTLPVVDDAEVVERLCVAKAGESLGAVTQKFDHAKPATG